MKKRMVIVLIVLLVVFGGIFGFDIIRSYLIARFIAHFVPPPATVSTAKAESQGWQPTLSAVGSLAAINGVDVSSEIGGIVTAIRFRSGQMVSAGQSLVQLDDASAVQDLKTNQAQLNLTRVTFLRQKALFRTSAVSKSAYDQAYAQYQQAEAAVAKSLVEISNKNIRAPFAGKIGIRQVNLGQYVNPGEALVSLQTLDPLFVNFSLPEQYLKAIRVSQPLSITVDAYPGERFDGAITAINALVTQATRSINLQGQIPNKDLRLYPGSFADVTLYLPVQQSVITLPQTAVTYSLYGNTVYVVRADGKDEKNKPILHAYQRFVTVGEMKDNKVVILDGIKAGEEVVTAGQNKLNDGIVIVINNDVKLPPIKPDALRGG